MYFLSQCFQNVLKQGALISKVSAMPDLGLFHTPQVAIVMNKTAKTELFMKIITGDPLHSRAACTQPCNVNTHSRAHCSLGARLCEQWGHGCVNNEARLCASARLCRGSPVIIAILFYSLQFYICCFCSCATDISRHIWHIPIVTSVVHC